MSELQPNRISTYVDTWRNLSPAMKAIVLTTFLTTNLAVIGNIPNAAASSGNIPAGETPTNPTKTPLRLPGLTPKPNLIDATSGTQFQIWNQIQGVVRPDQPIDISSCLVDPGNVNLNLLKQSIDDRVLPKLKQAVNNMPNAQIRVQCGTTSANLIVLEKPSQTQTPNVKPAYPTPRVVYHR